MRTMKRAVFAWAMVASVIVVAASGCSAPPAEAAAAGDPRPDKARAEKTKSDEAVYFVRHSVRGPDLLDPSVSQIGYYGVTSRGSKGDTRAVTLRPLWSRESAGAAGLLNITAMDPAQPDEKLLLDALNGGFLATVPAKGEPGALQPVDAAKWAAFKAHDAQAAAYQLTHRQVPGLRPMALPSTVEVGDQLTERLRLEQLGTFEVRLQVLQVTPDDVLLSMAFDDAGVRGDGRKVVRRADGMPIEMRMHLEHDAVGDAPAAIHEVHAADMAYDLQLDMAYDVEMYRSYLDQVRQTLREPPYGALSDEPGHYVLSTIAPGELDAHMVGADMLAGYEKQMVFGRVAVEGQRGPTLALGAPGRLSKTVHDDPMQAGPLLIARLDAVELLDGKGAVMKDVIANPVLDTLFFTEAYRISDDELQFPFHLPLGTPREVGDRIGTVRMQVRAEVYTWDSVEVIDLGSQSARNPNARITSSAPHRVTMLQDREVLKSDAGVVTTLVALDADGKEIPAAQMTMVPLKDSAPTTRWELPLGWEHRDVPMHTELAASRPIAKLQLRHYRWHLEPRQWDFRKIP